VEFQPSMKEIIIEVIIVALIAGMAILKKYLKVDKPSTFEARFKSFPVTDKALLIK
jgi:hypothetical protein